VTEGGLAGSGQLSAVSRGAAMASEPRRCRTPFIVIARSGVARTWRSRSPEPLRDCFVAYGLLAETRRVVIASPDIIGTWRSGGLSCHRGSRPVGTWRSGRQEDQRDCFRAGALRNDTGEVRTSRRDRRSSQRSAVSREGSPGGAPPRVSPSPYILSRRGRGE